MDEKSDAVIEHTNEKGQVVSRDAATLTFGGLMKAFGGVAVMLVGAILLGGFGFYVATVRDNATQAAVADADKEDRARLREAIDANSKAVQALTSTIEKLPTVEELERRAARATTEAVDKSIAYTDAKIAGTQQDLARMATDVAWIRAKQDEQGREIKEGFKAIEKRLSELPK
jgi:hypothetical protein